MKRQICALALLLLTGDLEAQCGNNSPATTVPRFRAEAPGQSIWPVNLDGQPTLRPASDIPARRDSTDYTTQGLPTAAFGHELFQDLDIVASGDFLFMVYSGGIEAWDLRDNPANPRLIDLQEGWEGDFLSFPVDNTETHVYYNDISALELADGEEMLVAAAGNLGAGVGLWRFTRTFREFEQLYQDDEPESQQIRLFQHGERIYAASATFEGVDIYDVTEAGIGPACLDDRTLPGRQCAGVFLGAVGSMTSGSYLDLIEHGGEIYLVATDGNPLPNAPLGLQIWHLANPSMPATGSVLKFSGLASKLHGAAFFELPGHGGGPFLAVIEAQVIRIFDAAACLDADGCLSLPLVWQSEQLTPVISDGQFLDVSISEGSVFLYYGVQTAAILTGRRVEHLFDLSDLLAGGPREITDTGTTYVDSCNSELVDYWGDYYEGNDYGLANFIPRHGKFSGRYFYRAANGIFDVHQRLNLENPTLFIDGFEFGNCDAWAVVVGGC